NIPLALRIRGPLDLESLERALSGVVDRHEALRTVFIERDGVPLQCVLASHLARVDLRRERIAAAELLQRLAEGAAVQIELNAHIPFVASLFEIAPDDQVLLCVFHHIAADGWSMGPFGRDLAKLYAAHAAGTQRRDAALAVQYADYTLWQREVL